MDTPSSSDLPLPPSLADSASERREAIERALAEHAPGEQRWPGDADRVLACSDYVAHALTQDPALARDLLSSGDLAAPYPLADDGADGRPATYSAYAAHTRAALAGAQDETTLMRVLRQLRRREMVRIAWRDIGGLAGLEEALRDASALADALLEGALEWLHQRLVVRFGGPRSAHGEPQRLTVLGLGKLGACELNFSSDIDLMFAFAEPGTTDGERTLDNTEFFTRLGRRLIKVLDERTDDGYVFRVDMRLRPFGSTGPLAMSFDAMEQYYQTHGRDWERYALIRARIVAGDHDGGQRLVDHLRPFVYRRYFDFGALESMREMKTLINEEVARRSLTDNVKLGAGGIREIEFTGQAFQMVRGGRLPELRGRRIMTVLEHIGALELLPDHAVTQLTEAYRFLRTLEHRLQQVDDRQTHTLPSDDRGRLRLATGMGYPDWPALARDIVRHRQRVGAQFDQVFGAPAREEGEPEALEALWEDEDLEAERAMALLSGLGFDDAQAACDLIERSRRSNAIRHMDQHARQRLARLGPDLVRACAAQANDEQTLARVLVVIETVARRSAYLALLAERPLALSQLVRLCSASPWIGRLIARHPVLLDELLDSRTLYAPLDRADLELDLDARLADCEGDTEREMEALRLFKQANVLKVAAVDVANVMPLMVVSDHLTQIAETTLRAALRLTWRDLVVRYGEPRFRLDGEERTAPFAIVAYGKLGGLELGYGSDLDLVFIHGSRGERQLTAGPKVVDNAVFFSRLAQRLIHFLTTLTGDGVLYEVDARLRPEGSAGMMVNGVAGLRQYLHEKAWTWEHQALVRARFVAGDEALGGEFAEIRREVLLTPRDEAELREAVRSMRQKMRDALGSGRGAGFDLKQDVGGIADIEFMVQYGALRWAEKLGDSLNYTDNIRLLEGFASAGLMSEGDTAFLMDAYRAYRARVHRLALQEQEVIENEDEFREQRAGVERLWRELMELGSDS